MTLGTFTFNKWVGHKKDQDPGATVALRAFKMQRQKFLSTLQSRKARGSIEKLSNYLNNLLFPKTEQKNGLVQRYEQLLVQSYNQVFSKHINELNGFAPQRYANSSQEMPEKFQNSVRIKSERKNESFRVFEANKKEIEQLLKDIENNGNNTNIIENSIKELKKSLASATLEIETALKDSSNGEITLDDLLNSNQMMIKKSLQTTEGEIHGDLLKYLRDIDSLYLSLKNNFYVSNTDAGLLWEYILALLSDTEEKFEQIIEGNIQNYLDQTTKNAMTGNQKATRNGLLIDVSGIEMKGQINNRVEIDNNGKQKTVKTFSIGNVEFDYDPQQSVFNTGATKIVDGQIIGDKQGKMDINFNLPINKGGGNFRISAKNWRDISSNNNLGHTNILNGLSRSFYNSTRPLLEFYLYSLQQPEDSISRTNILQEAHNIAKAGLIMDIAVGYSQENHYANTLVILDRTSRRVLVFDLNEVINDIISSNQFTNSHRTLSLTGYPEGELYQTGVDIRSSLLKTRMNKRGSNDFSKMYLSMMAAYIHNIDIIASFNPSFY